MKMTDQMERDFFQAEMTGGSASRDNGSDADGFKAASLLMGVLIFGALLMIWLGG